MPISEMFKRQTKDDESDGIIFRTRFPTKKDYMTDIKLLFELRLNTCEEERIFYLENAYLHGKRTKKMTPEEKFNRIKRNRLKDNIMACRWPEREAGRN